MSDINMSVNIAGVELKNPVTVASGTFGSGMEYGEYVDLNRLGAVTTKGVANIPWPGNPTPRIAETYGGMMNAIGLQNPGLDTFVKRDIPFLKQYDTKIIVNVCGKSEADYVDAVEKLGEQPVDLLEINISCPNVKEGGIAFGQVPASAEAITKAVKKVAKQPVIMKLSPNVTDITEMAKAVEAGGADAVSLINTLTGMKIDVNRRTFAVANKTAGVSGPAIHPIAVRMVYQVANAINLPIIGMGGIRTAEDALEMIMVGASAVAVGTANFNDPYTTIKVIDGIREYMEKNNVADIKELIDYVFDINTKLDAVCDYSGRYCFDRLGKAVWHYILDHPFYHHDSLKVPLKNMNVICLDEMHKKFIDETYPHINSCIVLPLAAKQAESGLKPYDMRDNDLIFTASYTDPDMVYFKAKKQDSENVVFFNTFTQRLFDNPELTQEEAIRQMYPGISGVQTAEKLQENFMADVYIQAAIRQEIVVQLIRNHVPVKLYGHNWDTFLTKAEVLMKDNLTFIKEFVKVCGEVTYGELPAIYNNARLSINQLPWFKAGIHDRTPLALMNGCVSITDGSTYMRREIPMDSGVEYYSLDELENVGEKIKSLVADVGSMKEKVARGVQYAEDMWSWKHWAVEFVEAAKEC